MRAAAHTPGGYDGVSQAVGREFVEADKKSKKKKLPERVDGEQAKHRADRPQRRRSGGHISKAAVTSVPEGKNDSEDEDFEGHERKI